MTNGAKNRIAEVRNARKMTQQELADAVGAHWITISKLERSRMKLTTDWLDKLAIPLGVRARDLLPPETPSAFFAEPEERFEKPSTRISNRPRHKAPLEPGEFGVAMTRPLIVATPVRLMIEDSTYEPWLYAGDSVELVPWDRLRPEERTRIEGRLCFFAGGKESGRFRFALSRKKSGTFGFAHSGKKPGTYDLFWFGRRVAEGVEAASISVVKAISFRMGGR
jgi:DNA-binding XRE family transcriptional regulator